MVVPSSPLHSPLLAVGKHGGHSHARVCPLHTVSQGGERGGRVLLTSV